MQVAVLPRRYNAELGTANSLHVFFWYVVANIAESTKGRVNTNGTRTALR